MQRVARAGEGQDVIGLETLLCGQRVNEGVGLFIHIAPALGDPLGDGVGGLGTGAYRVLVGVDLHRVGRDRAGFGKLRKRALVVKRQRRACRQQRGHAVELPAGNVFCQHSRHSFHYSKVIGSTKTSQEPPSAARSLYFRFKTCFASDVPEPSPSRDTARKPFATSKSPDDGYLLTLKRSSKSVYSAERADIYVGE